MSKEKKVLAEGEKAVKQGNGGVWQLMQPVGSRMRWVYLSSGFSAMTSLLSVYLLVLLMYRFEREVDRQVWTFVGALVACVTASFMLRLLSYYLSHLAAFRLENILRAELCDKFSRLSLARIQELGTGAMSKVVVDDVRELHAFVADTTPIISRLIIAPIMTIGLLFYLDWRLAGIVLLILVAVMAYLNWVIAKNSKVSSSYGQAREEVNASIVEFIQAMPVVRTFDGGHSSFSRYQRALDTFSDFVSKWYREVASIGNVLMVLLNPLFTLMFLLWMGSGFYWNGSLGMGTWIGFLLMSAILAETILPLLLLQSTLQKLVEPVARIHQFRQLPEPVQLKGECPAVPGNHDVVFEAVSFSYPGSDEPALRDVTVNVPSGTVTALVGASGAGKSTLALLLPRFQDPTAGRIRIGGVDIREMQTAELLGLVGFVFQDNFLFSGSIADNIRLGKPEASQEDIERAAQIAQAHDFITQLAEGYETRVGERGTFLSGGQKQRITIARAILMDRPILVLDEATAFADPENEALITRALLALMKNRTVIIVAHRLSMIRNADQIVVLDDGRVKEAGTHESLISRNGIYKRLCGLHDEAGNWSIRSAERQMDAEACL